MNSSLLLSLSFALFALGVVIVVVKEIRAARAAHGREVQRLIDLSHKVDRLPVPQKFSATDSDLTLAEEFPLCMTMPATPFLRLIEQTIVTHPEFGTGVVEAVQRNSVTVLWNEAGRVTHTDPSFALNIHEVQPHIV